MAGKVETSSTDDDSLVYIKTWLTCLFRIKLLHWMLSMGLYLFIASPRSVSSRLSRIMAVFGFNFIAESFNALCDSWGFMGPYKSLAAEALQVPVSSINKELMGIIHPLFNCAISWLVEMRLVFLRSSLFTLIQFSSASSSMPFQLSFCREN